MDPQFYNSKHMQNYQNYQQNYNPVSSYFGNNVFSFEEMKKKLPTDVYIHLKEKIEHNKPIDINTARIIAPILKDWAISKGCNFFCHWFQPLCRPTAEKFDSFINYEKVFGDQPLETLTHQMIFQGEPDASSFPHGGMRSTFEARGYTTWDPSSPIFVLADGDRKNLVIPSIFITYGGASLDVKGPLMKSQESLSLEYRKVLKHLGHDSTRVLPTLGPEQEFFLIPKGLFKRRPDLFFCGRTLIGKRSPKGQALEDHYFGSIPIKVKKFFRDLEDQAYLTGIPFKTKHNEVAPSQFETAIIYRNANLANDQNQILMQLMREIASKNELTCLFHEKPFAGLSGSGKHCNWSAMSVDSGRNLLSPGKTKESLLEFLLNVAIVVNGVWRRGNILRAGIITPGNEFRLGGHEAPPSIISVFLGDPITNLLEKISQGDIETEIQNIELELSLGIEFVPKLRQDSTDRNRTSPFAFTGDKFEFRAVGSSQVVGFPVTLLNVIMCESLDRTSDLMESIAKESGLSFEKDISLITLKTIAALYKESKAIVFNENNYSAEWHLEAKKRGLPVIENNFEALDALSNQETFEIFEKYKVYTKTELLALKSILGDSLITPVLIEMGVLKDMISTGVLPAIVEYVAKLKTVNDILKDDDLLESFGNIYRALKEGVKTLMKQRDSLEEMIKGESHDFKKIAAFIYGEIRPVMEEIKHHSDIAEATLPNSLWPYPSIRSLVHSFEE